MTTMTFAVVARSAASESLSHPHSANTPTWKLAGDRSRARVAGVALPMVRQSAIWEVEGKLREAYTGPVDPCPFT